MIFQFEKPCVNMKVVLFLVVTIVESAFSASIRQISSVEGGPQPVPDKYVYFPNDKGNPQIGYLYENPKGQRKIVPEKDITFHLYTKKNPQAAYQLLVDDANNLKNSPFSAKRPTKIICHGFTSDVGTSLVQNIKNEYLEVGDYNVIGIDWKSLAASPWYYSASVNTMDVAEYTAQFLEFLVKNANLNLDTVHILGHSLGAHVAGLTGKHVTSGTLGRVTGFDPAKPLYELAREKWKLTSKDAKFVDVIHTSGGELGLLDPIGHLDFYPNGGQASQPGCGLDITAGCSHSRSYEYFTETISREKAFPVTGCKTVKQATSGKCTIAEDKTPVMGEAANKYYPGLTSIYYTTTNKQSPYGIN